MISYIRDEFGPNNLSGEVRVVFGGTAVRSNLDGPVTITFEYADALDGPVSVFIED